MKLQIPPATPRVAIPRTTGGAEMADLQLRCSFCGKTKSAVRRFISGKSAYICNECVALCNTILASEEAIGSLGTGRFADSPDGREPGPEFRRTAEESTRPNSSFPSGN
jgi:hypothetical protein